MQRVQLWSLVEEVRRSYMPCNAAKKKKSAFTYTIFYECICYCCIVAKKCPFATPWTVSHQAPLSMGFSTGVACHFLLQGIFLTQGLNPSLLHSRQILYHWANKEVQWLYIPACYLQKHSMVCSDSDMSTVFKELIICVRANTWWPCSGTKCCEGGKQNVKEGHRVST